jgi:DNA-binding NtrC family response regulator
VVVLTAMGSIELAVDAMKLGAYDFLQKPVDATRLRTILANATRQRETEIELEVARRRLRETGVLGGLVGNSKAMREIFGLIEQIAPSNVSVLITGESGTGKELVARTLHTLSPRKPRPFVAVNCAAIPETLIESEIFGHEKGAFTGAVERRAGCFELASGGTLLLDELAEMPAGTQAKLLRVLEERKLRGWERAPSRTWTCACWPPPIAIPTRRLPRGNCARPLLPAQRLPHCHAAAARAHGRPARHGRRAMVPR